MHQGGSGPQETVRRLFDDHRGVYTKTKKGNPVEHFRNDYYCGTGLGEDSVVDGKDDGRGVFTQASGPVALRLVKYIKSLNES